MRIQTKLISSFLAISLPVLISTSVFFYSSQKNILTNQILNHLKSVASIQHTRIESILMQNLERLRLVSSRTQLRQSLAQYNEDHEQSHINKIVKIVNDAQSSISDFENISILAPSGIVVASTDQHRPGKDYSQTLFFLQGKEKDSADQLIIDKEERLKIILSGPLTLNDKFIGVLMIESNTKNILSSISDYTGLGDTGETVLARRDNNKEVTFVMPTRFDSHAALNLTIPKHRNLPINQAFQTQYKIFKDALDYRGVPIIAVTRYVEENGWGIVVKMDKAEALAPIVKMRNLFILIIVASSLTIILLSIYLARSITQPILQVIDVAKNISSGNFIAQADESKKDETGILAKAFNNMTRELIDAQKFLAEKLDEIQDKEEHIRFLLNSAAEAIYGTDASGKCTFCNPACLHLLGYQEDKDLLGKEMHSLIHHTKPDGSKYLPTECKISLGLQNNKLIHVDDEILWRADGTSFWAEYWSHPVIKNNEIVGSVVTFLDISERNAALADKQRLNDQLKQAQKMEAIGTLAGGIAHDFNNILSAILGYAELAKIKTSEDNPIFQHLEEVLKAGNRAKDLVLQILTFSRKTDHEPIPVEVHFIISEAIKLLRASIPSTIKIQEDIAVKDDVIMADPTQLHQVLMNLGTNAYQAMSETGGILAVKLNQAEITKFDNKVKGLHLKPGKYLKLEVSDTGHGMDSATIERIFEPYFTTKTQGRGTGMGLSMVHGIVKKLGGHVSVYSTLGKGTSFVIYLPKAQPEDLSIKPANTDTALPGGHERILIVDDEKTILHVAEQMLLQLGYKVCAFSNCPEALKTFQNDPAAFDLVITDMTMPEMTGAELAQAMMAVRIDLPIILCTGFSELINEKEAKAIGIREYIMKPVEIKRLATIVRKVLDGQQVVR